MKFKCEMPLVAMSHAHGDQRLAGHSVVFVSDVTTVISIQCRWYTVLRLQVYSRFPWMGARRWRLLSLLRHAPLEQTAVSRIFLRNKPTECFHIKLFVFVA